MADTHLPTDKLDERFYAYWSELVPSSGAAPTVKGEFCRAFGRLERECFNNDNCNAYDLHGTWFLSNAMYFTYKFPVEPHAYTIRMSYDRLSENYGEMLSTLHTHFLATQNVEAATLTHAVAQIIELKAADNAPMCENDESPHCGHCHGCRYRRPRRERDEMSFQVRRVPCFLKEDFIDDSWDDTEEVYYKLKRHVVRALDEWHQ